MVTIKECGEKLVDIKIECLGISTKNNRSIFVRKTIAEMLSKAQAILPKTYDFFVLEGWRSKERQEAFHKTYTKLFHDKHPDWSDSKIGKEVKKFVHPYKGKWASGHMTGAAVDVFLMKDGIGLNLNDDNLSFEGNASPYPVKLQKEVKKNRKILSDSLSKAGFCNSPNEYWHWSYGDIWHAKFGHKGHKETAKYGIVACPSPSIN